MTKNKIIELVYKVYNHMSNVLTNGLIYLKKNTKINFKIV